MKYKVLRSAAHNFGHSFVSLMNYGPDDYFMSYLARSAVRTGEPELRVDLLTGQAEPDELLSEPIRASIDRRVTWFPRHLAGHRVPVEAVQSARMCIRFNLARRSPDRGFPGHFQMPFECVVEIIDDRGKLHAGIIHDWWTAQTLGVSPYAP